MIDNGVGFDTTEGANLDGNKPSRGNKIIKERIKIYNEQKKGYLQFFLQRIGENTVATIKILTAN